MARGKCFHNVSASLTTRSVQSGQIVYAILCLEERWGQVTRTLFLGNPFCARSRSRYPGIVRKSLHRVHLVFTKDFPWLKLRARPRKKREEKVKRVNKAVSAHWLVDVCQNWHLDMSTMSKASGFGWTLHIKTSAELKLCVKWASFFFYWASSRRYHL